MTVLTRNGPKLIFYPGRHGLTRIDLVNSVLVKNNGFDPKRPETHFLPWSTWFDPYWPGGLGFDGKMRLTREKYFFEFSFFLIFWIFINNNRNKITFEKIFVDPKLGYNNTDLIHHNIRRLFSKPEKADMTG